VLDSGSTDDTCEIAASRGARVMTRAFDSFGRQRNYAMEAGQLRYDWVLHLDADEIVTPPVATELQGLARAEGAKYPVYRIASRIIFMGRWLRHAGMYPSYQVRFGRRDQLRFMDHGHGQREVQTPEQVGTLCAALDHFNFSKGVGDWLGRHLRYAAAEAEQVFREAGQPLALGHLLAADPTVRRRALKRVAARLPFRPALRFGYAYFARLGFLDGMAGFRYAQMLATYQRFIDLQLMELRSGRRS